MKKTIPISMLLCLLISCTALPQLDIRNDAHNMDKVIAEARKGRYQLITPEELKREYLKDQASFFLVDTRQEWAYQMQHIKGALHLEVTPSWWYPYSPMARSEMKKLLGEDKNKRVVFY